MGSLPIHVSPLLGESLYGYLDRLARANALSGGEIQSQIGLDVAELRLDGDVGRVLSQFIGLSQPSIDPLLWIRDGPVLRIHGGSIPRWLVHRYHSPVCLMCLAADMPHLAAWDFRPVRRCNIHGTTLTDRCPKCEEPLLRKRPDYRFCPRWHDLRNSSLAPGLAPDSEEARLNSVLYQIIEGHTPRLPSPLHHLDVADIALLSRLCGSLKIGQYDQVKRTWSGNDRETCNNGFSVIEQWPSAFRALLKRHLRQGTRPIPLLDIPANEFLKERMRREHDRPYAALIGAEIWSYARSVGVIPSPGTFGFTPPDFDDHYMSATKAAEAMEVGLDMLYRIAKSARWPGWKQLNRKSAAWLRHADVADWRRANAGKITLLHVARRFRADTRTIMDIVRAGCFGRAAMNRIPSDARSRWFATRDEIDAFVERIRMEVSRSSPFVAERTTWRRFAAKGTRDLMTLGTAIAGAFNRPGTIAGWKEPRVVDIEFDLAELRVLRRNASDLLSFKDIHREYALPLAYLREAQRSGLLRSIRKPTRTRTLRFRRAAIDEFATQYTCPLLLAKGCGITAKAVANEIQRRRIQPINHGRGRAPAIYDRGALLGASSLIAGLVGDDHA